jgi:DNA polymerase III subunit delta'
MAKTKQTQAPVIATDGLIGHRTVVDLLTRAMEGGRLAHGYLFAGPAQVGKGTVARALAASLLGTDRLATHPDCFLVERDRDEKTGAQRSGIGIDAIRALRSHLSQSAMLRGWKVAIIEDAQLLSEDAANALLKHLEEPHPRTLLILLADAVGNVLPTIRSRCQTSLFARVPVAELAAALRGRGIAEEAAESAARLSAGRPGLALRYAEDPETLADMRAMRETILGLHARPVAERWKTLAPIFPAKLPFIEQGIAANAFLDLAAELLRDALLMLAGADAHVAHVDVREGIARWAERSGAARIEEALRELAEARARIARNVGPRAALEHFVLAL